MELIHFVIIGVAIILWLILSVALFLVLTPWCRIHPFIWVVLAVIFPPFLIVIGLYITGSILVALCLLAYPGDDVLDVEYRVIDR
jgi:hypothetical protein